MKINKIRKFAKVINRIISGHNNIDATQGSIFKKLLIISFPMMLTMILHNLHGVVDNFWLGRFSPTAMAASQICRMFIWFIISVALGVGFGGRTLLSQIKGSQNHRELDHYAAQTIIILLLLSSLVSGMGLIVPEKMLLLVGTPETIIGEATIYTQLILITSPIMFYEIGLSVILNGIGNTFVPFLFTLISIIFNALLTPVLVFGMGVFPALGIEGAAIATVVSRLIAVVIGSYYIFTGKCDFRINFFHIIPSWQKIKTILKIGIPSSIGYWGTSLGFVVLMSIVTKVAKDFYGGETAIISAYGVANTAVGMYYLITAGLANGVSVMSGQNLGASQRKRAEQTLHVGMLVGSVFLIIGSLLMYFFGGWVSRFFVPSSMEYSIQTEEIVRVILKITSHGVVSFGLLNIIFGAFQGAGYTLPIMWINLSRLWIFRVPLAYVLAFTLGMGGEGIWWGISLSNHITIIFGLFLLFKGEWKNIVILNQEEYETA